METGREIGESHIKQAAEILSQRRAKIDDIAWAWVISSYAAANAQPKHNEEHYRAIHAAKQFILELALPTTGANGLPARPNKGVSVPGLDVRETQYVCVKEVEASAKGKGMEWPQPSTVEPTEATNTEPTANQADKYPADWPLCTKQEIIDGFQLKGKDWNDFLSRPNKYSEAVKQPGKKGVGGDALFSPIIFASLLVKFEDLLESQVKARFVKVEAWKKWEAEMLSEIGSI